MKKETGIIKQTIIIDIFFLFFIIDEDLFVPDTEHT